LESGLGLPYTGRVHRVILHLDMDAFFAAVEQRDNPALRGRPVIVGGTPGQRGVVAAASYEARQFGVRSAMPSTTAGRLCPRGIFIPPRISAYREESARIMEIISETGAIVEKMSIDEAYLDVSAVVAALHPSGPDPDEALRAAVPIARALQCRIQRERRLTASIGIAANKFLAKIGSDFQKPNGLTLIPERDKVQFLRPLPVRTVHGVGRVTEQGLQAAGIFTVGNLQDYQGDLRSIAGSFGTRLKMLAFGQDDRPLELGDEIKSISAEETFSHDTEDRRQLRGCLREQSQDVASRLKRRQLAAHTVQVKLRYGDFTTLSRQITLQDPITEAAEIYRLGCHLLAREKLVNRPLRLLGLGVSGLTEAGSRQLMLL
jgi:DNA polymerase IV